MMPRRCGLCGKSDYRHVQGIGNPKAKIIFVGEAPGAQEDRLGRPFVGPAGQFLNRQLAAIGINRKDVWITNVVKHRSIGPPDEQSIARSLPVLIKELKTIRPKIVVLLGNTAIKAVLGKEYSVVKCHGKIIVKNKIRFMPTPHPSAARQYKKMKQLFLADFKRLATLSRAPV